MTTINAQINQNAGFTSTVFNALSAIRPVSNRSFGPASIGSFSASKLIEKTTGRLARFYSKLLGEEVTANQSLSILHAKVAFLTMVFPMEMPVLYHIATVAWFAIALKKCREAGL